MDSRDRSVIKFDSFTRFEDDWKRSLAEGVPTLRDEFPDYHVSSPECLVSTSNVNSFCLGTGASIFARSLLPAIAKAKHEVILVTCFWAPSPTLTALRETLEQLARYRRELINRTSASNPGIDELSPLRIRICFSSRSFLQKLFHPASKDGYVYPPSAWSTRLGLPSPEVLEAGLIDLRVKSLFFLPFSVMHPKFLIVDRQRAWLPSCNVSWETWLEGCVEVTGEIVPCLVEFYRHVWDKQLDDQLSDRRGLEYDPNEPPTLDGLDLITGSDRSAAFLDISLLNIPTVLLPSSHHRNPRFDIIPWHNAPSPPPTPLNTAILQLLDTAEHIIYMQTPNLTSGIVVEKLLGALKRGVNVTIVTSARLMILEQLVTAGTTTSRCVHGLVREYKKLEARTPHHIGDSGRADPEVTIDIEAQQPRLGSLNIYFFQPRADDETVSEVNGLPEGPVQSHLKLTIVDAQYVVLGSGNMDRASWFTSQELGIMFHSKGLVPEIAAALARLLDGRRNLVFSSQESPVKQQEPGGDGNPENPDTESTLSSSDASKMHFAKLIYEPSAWLK